MVARAEPIMAIALIASSKIFINPSQNSLATARHPPKASSNQLHLDTVLYI